MLGKLWEYLVRFRTWLFNIAFAAMLVLPDVLNAPEVQAVVPPQYQKYVLVAAFLVNIWLRPRPAVMAKDVK